VLAVTVWHENVSAATCSESASDGPMIRSWAKFQCSIIIIMECRRAMSKLNKIPLAYIAIASRPEITLRALRKPRRKYKRVMWYTKVIDNTTYFNETGSYKANCIQKRDAT